MSDRSAPPTISAEEWTAMPFAGRRLLLSLRKISVAARPIDKLLAEPDKDREPIEERYARLRRLAGESLGALHNLASVIPSLYSLLARMDENPKQAWEQYEELCEKLRFFFEARGSTSPLEDADETLDRTTRRIEEGVEIEKGVFHFCFGVAKKVWLEKPRRNKRWLPMPDIEVLTADDRSSEKWDATKTLVLEQKIKCQVWCLKKLLPEDRWLIVEYSKVEGERREGAGYREKLAEQLGMPRATLSTRIFNIRRTLNQCVGGCLENKSETEK